MSLFIYPPAASPSELADILLAVDTLETSVASTNTKLDTVNANLDAIELLVDGVEGSLTAMSTNIGDIEIVAMDILNKIGANPFTLTYNQMVKTVDATHDYYQTKLLGADRQLMTVTYTDSTKQDWSDLTVTTSS